MNVTDGNRASSRNSGVFKTFRKAICNGESYNIELPRYCS